MVPTRFLQRPAAARKHKACQNRRRGSIFATTGDGLATAALDCVHHTPVESEDNTIHVSQLFRIRPLFHDLLVMENQQTKYLRPQHGQTVACQRETPCERIFQLPPVQNPAIFFRSSQILGGTQGTSVAPPAGPEAPGQHHPWARQGISAVLLGHHGETPPPAAGRATHCGQGWFPRGDASVDAILLQPIKEGIPGNPEKLCGLNLVPVGLLVGGGDKVFDHLVKADT